VDLWDTFYTIRRCSIIGVLLDYYLGLSFLGADMLEFRAHSFNYYYSKNPYRLNKADEYAKKLLGLP